VYKLKFLFVLIILATSVACSSTPSSGGKEEKSSGEAKIVDDKFKSPFAYEVIKYTPSSRHYSVQQKDGEVTLESATAIVQELFSKEAFADNGGVIGNVVIYDNKVKLKKNESPAMDIEEKAEYDSRNKIINFGGKQHAFEPAYK